MTYMIFEEAKQLKLNGYPQGKSEYKYACIEKTGYLELIPQDMLIKTIDVEYYDAPPKEEFAIYISRKLEEIEKRMDRMEDMFRFL
jgi:hypothetical protein